MRTEFGKLLYMAVLCTHQDGFTAYLALMLSGVMLVVVMSIVCSVGDRGRGG